MFRSLISALAFVFAAATISYAASTEYILVHADSDVSTLDKSLTIGKPSYDFPLTGTNGYCGKYYNTVLGYQTDAQFSGTVYGVHTLSIDTSGAKGGRIFTNAWVVGEDVGPAKRFSQWAPVPKSEGQTCQETVNGVLTLFKKYFLICDDCA